MYFCVMLEIVHFQIHFHLQFFEIFMSCSTIPKDQMEIHVELVFVFVILLNSFAKSIVNSVDGTWTKINQAWKFGMILGC